MRALVVAGLVLLTVLGVEPVAAAQLSAPPPAAPNLPWWFVKNPYPGMPWFYRPPAWPTPRPCQIAYWYPAQFWKTDAWGRTVTWTGYAPHYVCF